MELHIPLEGSGEPPSPTHPPRERIAAQSSPAWPGARRSGRSSAESSSCPGSHPTAAETRPTPEQQEKTHEHKTREQPCRCEDG